MDNSQRNIVMVTADSLRADHCGFINAESTLTPTIDDLADEGQSFTQAIAPGPRTPSSAPVFSTGEFMANDNEWTMSNWSRRQERIGEHMERYAQLSEHLQSHGYNTAAFTANPWTTRESNFDIGFEDFYEISANSDDVSSKHLSDSRLFKIADTSFEIFPGDPFDWSWKKEWFSQWSGYFDLIREKIAELSEPFFIWVFILDSHQPYITPRRYRDESSAWEMYYSILKYWQGEISDEELPSRARKMISQAYRDAVRSVDAFVDSLYSETEPYDPITVFFSDHGEALGEHGHFGHKQTLYEENLHVPLFIHNAGVSGLTSAQLPLRSIPDILVDLSAPSEFDPKQYTQRFVVSQTENGQVKSVRTDRWKYITDGETEYLYDRRTNPIESTDISENYPKVTSILSDILMYQDVVNTETESIVRSATQLSEDPEVLL